MNLSNPTGTVTHGRNEDVFVDDANLSVNGARSTQRIQIKAQQHEQGLLAAGGKLALHKCSWVVLQWAWSEGTAKLQTYAEDPKGYCTHTSPHTLKITESETQREHIIPQLNPTKYTAHSVCA